MTSVGQTRFAHRDPVPPRPQRLPIAECLEQGEELVVLTVDVPDDVLVHGAKLP